MTITSIKYTSDEETAINVVKEDGSQYSASWPCYTWHREEIQNAIDSGVAIQPYRTNDEKLTFLKNELSTKIKAIRDQRQSTGGYLVELDSDTSKWFQSDQASRIQQLALSMNDSIPSGLMWKTMDGSFVVMTKIIAGKVVAACTASDIAIFTYAEERLAEIASATEVSVLESFDVHAGWAKVYGE